MSENRIDPAFDSQGVVAAEVANLRNQLVAWCEHIAVAATKARDFGCQSALLDDFFLDALSAACQSSSVDERALAAMCVKADYVAQLAESLGVECEPDYQKKVEAEVLATIKAIPELDASVFDDTIAESASFSKDSLRERLGDTVYGLQETILAGLKGVATTLRIAIKLASSRKKREFEAKGIRARIKSLRPRKKEDKDLVVQLTAQAEAIEAEIAEWRDSERFVLDGIAQVLAFLSPEPVEQVKVPEEPDPHGFDVTADATDVDALVAAAAKTGELAVAAFKVYEYGVFHTYGAPIPTSVRTTQVPGVCVAYSGEDFDALTELLERAEFSDVNVVTRGEAIAAHSLPAFKKYRRLVGHYGTDRSRQNKELGAFPGSIVFSTPTFDEPSDDFADYVFSTKDSCWNEVKTVARKPNGSMDLDAVIRAAQDSGGYSKAKPVAKLPLGFGGDQIPSLVEKSARAYRTGALKRVFAIGGVDAPDQVYGPDEENVVDYYPRLYAASLQKGVSLTFGDVKFRFAHLEVSPTAFGVPHSIDMGRARDMNAVLRFAADLNKELDKTPETSPVAFFVSVWDERSVACLLAPCALGYRDVLVGPYRPSVWTEDVFAALSEKLNVRMVGAPEEDAAYLGVL
ncbi:MAG: hypothetical protein IJM54_10035 [Thermoguttaceae bacterium]|nr:hypothetical protein [Thermoguttaceae bacterium]